ncbi:MAG TPA: hypothetical protein PLN24_05245, partial [Victivallales bacterium]|nr:hypothetical protein [Victivallales bacterium]
MNINFLPSKVKENIKKICNDKMILNAARSNTTINGENGEGYLIDLGDKIIFMSRKMGENDFSVKEFSDKIIGKIIKDNFNVYLNIKTSLDENKIKFSSLEENDLAKIAKKLLTISDNENQKKDLPQANAEGNFEKDNKKSDNIEKKINDIDNNSKIQPIILFGAAMMYIAKSDQIVAKEEDFYVIS